LTTTTIGAVPGDSIASETRPAAKGEISLFTVPESVAKPYSLTTSKVAVAM
jgi:hypothetical protein